MPDIGRENIIGGEWVAEIQLTEGVGNFRPEDWIFLQISKYTLEPWEADYHSGSLFKLDILSKIIY